MCCPVWGGGGLPGRSHPDLAQGSTPAGPSLMEYLPRPDPSGPGRGQTENIIFPHPSDAVSNEAFFGHFV